MRICLSSLLLAISNLSTLALDTIFGNPSTTVAQGVLSGSWKTARDGRRIASFQGIPYAEPPVHNLRFQSPQPAKAWCGTKVAVADGPKCVQKKMFLEGISGEEDCLYLNVYTPNITGSLPFLFFIHGGNFETGSATSLFYGPEFLLDEDIVLVTINYRLNVFGFLSLDDNALPGNLGLKDQRLALRWVRDNIAQFGGDPERVTIFGESAGAKSAHHHVLFNAEEGLFRAAILHSGSSGAGGSFQIPGEQKPLVDYVLNHTNCAAESKSESVECLKKVPAHVLFQTWLDFAPPSASLLSKTQLSPVLEPECVEDAFITQVPYNKTFSIPMIVGVNKYEGLYKIIDLLKDKSDKKFEEFNRRFNEIIPYNLMFASMTDNLEEVTNATRKFYLKDDKVDRNNVLQLSNLIGDGIYTQGAAEAVKNNENITYLYSYNHLGVKSLLTLSGYKNTFGPTHADELFMFFPFSLLPSFEHSDKTKEDENISRQLVKMWANFVIHLDPNIEGDPVKWEPASMTNLQCLDINGLNNFTMNPHFYKERMDFWSNLPFRNKLITVTPTCEE